MHYSSIRKIVHIDALDELINYEQEIDRVERDELHAMCLTLLLIKWKISWNQDYQSDFLTQNWKKMTRYLRAQICLRRHFVAYLNENQKTACNDDDNESIVLCNVCSISKISRNINNENSSSLHATISTSKRFLLFNSISIVNDSSERASNDENFSNEKLKVETVDAVALDCMRFSKSFSSENEKNLIYDVVARLARNDLMKQAKDFSLYE